MSQRITLFYHSLPANMQSNLRHFIESTVQGTVMKAYKLMMSPVYAGKTNGVDEELKQYDRWLKACDTGLYKFCGHQRKYGLAYIRLWRLTGINLLKFK